MAPMVRAAVGFTTRPLQSTMCGQCFHIRAVAGRSLSQKRSIHLSVLQKRADAEQSWKDKATRIEKGEETHLWDKLKERGFVKDIAGDDKMIREIMLRKRIGAYVGIDPTAASLHVGHLLPLMALFWMHIHGYSTFSIIGGATAKVGDPTGRLQSREVMSNANVAMNITKTHYQMKRLWQNLDKQAARFGYQKEWAWSRGLLNNSQWLNTTPFMEIVQGLFQGMRMGALLSRETVKRKMEDGDGMSLSEFIYPLMQAWDWWHLYSSPRHVQMQIGGSDQYGNIISGIDAINYARGNCKDEATMKNFNVPHNTPIGFTVPLLTDSSGAKFGKSAGNAVWLDPFLTSTFDVYGYFMRRPDADVGTLLKLLTFLPMEDINRVLAEHETAPSKRPAHHALAFEVCSLIHGLAEAETARDQHKALYSKGGSAAKSTPMPEEVSSYPTDGRVPDINMAAMFRPHIQLPESLLKSKSIAKILFAAGLVDSSSEGHRLVNAQGAYIGGAPGQRPGATSMMNPGELTYTPVKLWFPDDLHHYLIDGKMLILRRGKNFVRIVEMVSDEDYAKTGETYPGQPGSGAVRKLREALRLAGAEAGVEFSAAELRRALTMEDEQPKSENNTGGEGETTTIEFPQGRAPNNSTEVQNSFAVFESNQEQKQKLLDRILKSAKKGGKKGGNKSASF